MFQKWKLMAVFITDTLFTYKSQYPKVNLYILQNKYSNTIYFVLDYCSFADNSFLSMFTS